MKLNRLLDIKVNYVVLMSYTILFLFMTYPLVLNFSTHIIGGGDGWYNIWNLWWMKKSLMELHANPYYTDYVYYPRGTTLVLSTLNPFNGLISIPLQYVFNLIAVYNIVILFSFVMSGYGMYVLVVYLTGDRYAGFISGFMFTFSPYHMAHLLGHLQLVAMEWVPFYILYLIKTVREKENKNPLIASFFLVLNTLCCWYYLFYMLVFTLLYVSFEFLANPKKILNKNSVARFLILPASFAVVMSPLIYAILPWVYSGLHGHNAVSMSSDLLSFFMPSTLHPLLGRFYPPINGYWNASENGSYIGYSVLWLILYVVFCTRFRGIGFWFISFILFSMLSMGPYLIVGGRVYNNVRLLYGMVSNYVPSPMDGSPARFSALMIMSSSVLVGYGISLLRRKHRLISVLIPAAIAFEYATVPQPIQTISVHDVYLSLAEEKDDFAIVEAPLSDWTDTKFLYLQTIHGKKMVSGYMKVPSSAYDFMHNSPTLKKLRSDSEKYDLKSNVTVGDLRKNKIKYIIYHRTMSKKSVEEFLSENFIEVSSDQYIILYRVY